MALLISCIRNGVLLGGFRRPIGWVKLNTVGSTQGNLDLAGAWGLERNEDGLWLANFVRNIRITASITAKLWRDAL